MILPPKLEDGGALMSSTGFARHAGSGRLTDDAGNELPPCFGGGHVGGGAVEDPPHVPSGVDHHALARVPVTDQVDEVLHLGARRVLLGDVATDEELSEVELAHQGTGVVHSKGSGSRWYWMPVRAS